VLRANHAITLDQRQDWSLVRPTLAMRSALVRVLIGLFAADVRFINFHHLVLTAEWAKATIGHRFTDTMAREPS
jgi:hypothetical protein